MSMTKIITTSLLIAVSAVLAQDGSDMKQMAVRFLQGARKSNGNVQDKCIEGMIEMATPSADEQCRQVQRNAVKYMLAPNAQISQQYFDSMIRAASGMPSQSSSPTTERPISSTPPLNLNSMKTLPGDSEFSRYVTLDSRFILATKDYEGKKEVYQPNSLAMKLAYEQRRQMAIDRGDVALKIFENCENSIVQLDAEYKKNLNEMKENHPDMLSLKEAIDNLYAIKKPLARAVATGCTAKLDLLLQGGSIVRIRDVRTILGGGKYSREEEPKKSESAIRRVDFDSLAIHCDDNDYDIYLSYPDKLTVKYERWLLGDPNWGEGRGLIFYQIIDRSRVEDVKDYYLNKKTWLNNSPELQEVIKELNMFRKMASFFVSN